MLTYKSRVSPNVFVSKKKKVGACAATYTIFFIFLFRCFINLFTNEVVLNIIAQAYNMKNKKPYEQPDP